MAACSPITVWNYNIGDRVFVLLNRDQQFEQIEGGYKICRRLRLRSKPAYQLVGAFFPHRSTNIFYESDIMSVAEFNQLTSEWHFPSSPSSGNS
jgi:hypothetical protein